MTGPAILLTTDGTYPCYPGGVSVWCDQLIRELPDARFHVFAITYSPAHGPVFSRPANVLSQQIFPLWGSEEPGTREEPFRAALTRRLRTTSSAIRSGFLDSFKACVRSILDPSLAPEMLAEALVDMHLYFRDYDYARTLASREVWDAFLRINCQGHGKGERPTVEEATTCLRWLERYLAITATAFPETEIVHTSMAGLAGIPGVIQKKLIGSQYLLSEHGIFLRELYVTLAGMKESVRCRRFLFSFYEAVGRMNYRYADAVTSLCMFNRKWQIRMGAVPEKIHITPNGVDSMVFRPRRADEPAHSHHGPVVLTMARIYPLKGIYDLLRAARIVQDRNPSVRWRILGEVGDRRYHAECLALAAELGMESHIEWSKSSNPAAEYRQADVFCLPSISEAMPYSVLEAMFSGCPVVATDVGGVSEMLAGTGLVVPPRDPQAMANAITSLLPPEGRMKGAALADRALNRARSSYSVEKCSHRFREIYGQLSDDARIASLSATG